MRARVGTASQLGGWSVKGDDDRVELIRRQVYKALEPADFPVVTFTARSILAQCPQRDDDCELRAIFNAIKRGPIPIPLADGRVLQGPPLRFITDPRWTDTFPTARKILEWLSRGANGEDCDGFVILTASLLMVSGWLPGAVIASKDGTEFVHVFPVAGYPKDEPKIWVPLDATLDDPSVGVGFWPGSFVKRMRVYGLMQDGSVVGREIR